MDLSLGSKKGVWNNLEGISDSRSFRSMQLEEYLKRHKILHYYRYDDPLQRFWSSNRAKLYPNFMSCEKIFWDFPSSSYSERVFGIAENSANLKRTKLTTEHIHH